MKNIKSMHILILALAALIASARPAAAAADTYAVDPVHSSALFKVGHLGISFVRGAFTDISGTVKYDKKNPANNFVEITIKTDSVNTFNADRDTHLRSDDFFDTAKYPDMSFKSKSFKKMKNGKFQVTGNFTLHGVTKTITVQAEVTGEGGDPWGNHRAGFETAFAIKRSDYGMDKMIPAAGDKVLITLVVEGIKNKE